MISIVPRISRSFVKRYVNIQEYGMRNFAIASKDLWTLSIKQQVSFCPIKYHPWKTYMQNMHYSSGKTQTIPAVEYGEIKDLPNHPEKLLIDVREPQELTETGKIPTSINIPLESVVQVLAEDVKPQKFQWKYGRRKPSFDDEVIFTCKLGKRALKAAEIARAMGFTNIKYYPGSWEDWVKNENENKN